MAQQFSLQNLNKNLAIALGAGAAGVGAYLLFLFIPSVIHCFSLVSDLRGKEQDLAVLTKHKSELPALQQDVEALRQTIALYAKKIPDEVDMRRLLQKLSSTAQETGVEITVLRPLEAGEEGPAQAATQFFKKVTIQIEANAGYHQVGQFINRLEMLDQFIAVEDIIIRAVPNRWNKHDVKLLVTAYELR